MRYTKEGTIGGVRNLELPPLSERSVEFPWNGDEKERYQELLQAQQAAVDDHLTAVEKVSAFDDVQWL